MYLDKSFPREIDKVKKNNIPVIFVLDYRAYNWKNKDEIAVYYSLVANEADMIIGSREEYDLAEGLLGLDGTDLTSAAYWQSKNAKIVIVTHGKQGSTAYTNDGQSFSIKPFPVKLLKSFGGGDGYTSAFLYSLFEGKEIIDCLEFGSASAAMLVGSGLTMKKSTVLPMNSWKQKSKAMPIWAHMQ